MKKIAFLKPILNFYLLGLIITTLSRLLLFLFFYDRVTETEGFVKLFPIGLRMDIIMLTYLAFLPTLLIVFLPTSQLHKLQGFIRYFLLSGLTVLLFMELATPNFLIQYDTRPNRLFVEYLMYPKEVGSMLLKSFGVYILFTVMIMTLVVYFLNKYSKKWFKIQEGAYQTKLILFPIVGFLLFFGARSSLTSPRPINASNAIFSADQFTNSLALNSTYTVSFAIYSLKHEEDMSKMYGKMKKEEAIMRVKKYMTASENDFVSDEIPLLHRQKSTDKKDKPYNLVIFLQESLGAEYVGCLGGLPLTPNLDALAKEGMLFTNLYATGTRSVRGIEAVTTGFLPTPSRSVVK
ncbi:MAG: sulfatase-like hydrolase/transferase, partial [Flavobacteriaceae bacterium]|nr:sulfatase-like hydrolase/transferase [Flavobacteriaceae bacterium]